MKHVYYGAEYSEAEIRRDLEFVGATFHQLTEDQLVARTAAQIAEGKIVGWFQGRMEFGPRALGNRSILADPRRRHEGHPQQPHQASRAVPPLLPSVLAECAGEYFETDYASPFMVMAYKIKPSMRAAIPAVVHNDGTGRLQTVEKDVNPLYWKLIRAFGDRTGVPVLLNTSFNENEPIVNTPAQAIDCFLRTRMDVLSIGSYFLLKTENAISACAVPWRPRHKIHAHPTPQSDLLPRRGFYRPTRGRPSRRLGRCRARSYGGRFPPRLRLALACFPPGSPGTMSAFCASLPRRSGKSALWRRAVDFASFLLACMVRLAMLPRFDVVIAMTSPPLIAVLAALFVRIKGGVLVSWIMDLNPDEAIAAGALRRESLIARASRACCDSAWRHRRELWCWISSCAIAWYRQGRSGARVAIVPPWAHSSVVHYDARPRSISSGALLTGKFVVMYSGNHSPCHPLDTVLEAARAMRDPNRMSHSFLSAAAANSARWTSIARLGNVLCLPYQPLEALAGSLSAADLHLVVMGDPFVGIVHPCKIYNILAVGSPCLYIGPRPSHVTELAAIPSARFHILRRHGDVAGVIAHHPPGRG
jgi:colanic acid biosynthesis glycosyl transferase WcaI